ncbi:hypothetical protein E2C01_053307 [Portunus trituberculatus]|uniref:Uncharacterized protein n=1 Tax=Portunus trituberculatus TaxID=210409 RepID=A0A5B7GGR0_PORTR|nr:hypothetical protein [Portunus trituberculatus]
MSATFSLSPDPTEAAIAVPRSSSNKSNTVQLNIGSYRLPPPSPPPQTPHRYTLPFLTRLDSGGRME